MSVDERRKHGLSLNGILPPITTPFNEDESIAWDKLEANFKKWNNFPFRGYVVEGSTGEYIYLTTEEKIELIRKSRKSIGKDKILIAGSGCESTKATIYLSKKMAEAGADAVMVVTPNYFKADMKDEAIIHHYTEVANNSPVPVILYNVPGYTHVELSLGAIERLSHHENIIGIKESGESIIKISSIIHLTKNEDFQILVGFAGMLLPSLYMGSCGGVCALANVLCKEVCDLYQLHLGGDQYKEKAVELQKRLIAPETAMAKLYGVAGLKHVMDVKGFYGGPTRSPLQKLNEKESEEFLSIFKKSGFK
ncbi:UNVERIFIED_CONTAM: hypothetical protein RMT77_003502 [Armadillidium vulgare]